MSLQTPSPPEGHGGPPAANPVDNGAPAGGRKRMSTGVKLVLMGVAGAALLYSCAPGIGSGISSMPSFWLFGNPFYRPPVAAQPCPPGTLNCAAPPGATTSTTTTPSSRFGSTTTTPSTTGTTPHSTPPATSQRGGFGGTAGTHGTGGS
jgi:hypothetical protein